MSICRIRSSIGALFGALYAEVKDRLQAAILRRFGLPSRPPGRLKQVDRGLLAVERRAPQEDVWHWPELDGVEPLKLVDRAVAT